MTLLSYCISLFPIFLDFLFSLNIFPWKNAENKYTGIMSYLYCLKTFDSAIEGKKINGINETHTKYQA